MAKKRWNHQGNMIPEVEYSEGIRPHGHYQVAQWLPTADGWYDPKFEEYLVILPGKIICLTRDGRVAPAGLKRWWSAAAGGDTILTYTATDVTHGVYDLTTGAAVTAATSYTKTQVTTALRSLGLILSSEDCDKFFSSPVGVAPYSYMNHQGDDPLRDVQSRRLDNFVMQHRIAILCDYVLELPYLPVNVTATVIDNLGTVASYTATQSNVWYVDWTATQYEPLAAYTPRTPYTFTNDSTGIFAYRKDLLRNIRGTGDFFIDHTAGRIYFYHGGPSGAATTAATGVSLSFYHYNHNSIVDTAQTTPFTYVLGPVYPGDFLMPTYRSNWTPVTLAHGEFSLTNTVAATFHQAQLQTSFDEVSTAILEQAFIIGQVLDTETKPRAALDKVRTNGHDLSWSTEWNDRMPGSATEGLSDKLTYAGAADTVVRVNIIRR